MTTPLIEAVTAGKKRWFSLKYAFGIKQDGRIRFEAEDLETAESLARLPETVQFLKGPIEASMRAGGIEPNLTGWLSYQVKQLEEQPLLHWLKGEEKP